MATVSISPSRQRIKERVAIKFVMTFNANFQCDIAGGTCDAKNDIAIVDLAVVERHLTALIYLSGGELCRTGDAAAVFASKGQIDALIAQRIQQRTTGLYGKRRPATIGERYLMGLHSQMSLVQSPPG